jgi:O-methyltransferase
MFFLKFVYVILKKVLSKFGYEIDAWKRSIGDNTYEQIVSGATYAPCLTDSAFISVYENIKNNTMVDKYRSYELWQLVKESSKLDGAIIEVGVWRGGTPGR